MHHISHVRPVHDQTGGCIRAHLRDASHTRSYNRPRRQPGLMLGLTRGRKPTVMEAIGMLVMPEFFTYRNLRCMTSGCTGGNPSEAACRLGQC